MFYRCTSGHEEVRWSFHAGRFCWHCGDEGAPAYALVVTPMTPDHAVPVHDAVATSAA